MAANSREAEDTEEDDEENEPRWRFEFMTVHSTRLKMFSDAVWSIVATIMIVPIINTKVIEEISPEHHEMDKVIKSLVAQLWLYFLAFLMVCSTWVSHVRTFQTMRYVTDLSIELNLVILLGGSFLPYFYSVMSRFRTTGTIIIYCCIQIFIGMVQCAQVFHAFNNPDLLKKRIARRDDEGKKKLKWRILRRLLVAPIFSLLAIIFSFFSIPLAFASLMVLLFYPWIQSFFVYLLSKIPVCFEIRSMRYSTGDMYLTERVRKNRIEAFTDGVFAITSTLLVLNLTEKHVPSGSYVKNHYHGNVGQALMDNWGRYVAYILGFMIIGLLWYIQLALFKNIVRVTRTMLFLNNFSLAFLGIIPLAFTFVMKFKVVDSVITGVRIACIAIVMIELLYTLIYLVAFALHRCGRKDDEMWLCARVQWGGSDFPLLLYQLVGLPVGCVIVFGLTYLKNRLVAVYVFMAIVVVYAFILVLMRTLLRYARGSEEPSADHSHHHRYNEGGESSERLTAGTSHEN